jgi:uncharacterized protein YjiS (DUF1127 family)
MPNGTSFQIAEGIIQPNNELFQTAGPDARGTGELAQTVSSEARQWKQPRVTPAVTEADHSHARSRLGSCVRSSTQHEDGARAVPKDARATLCLHWLISLREKIVWLQGHWRREQEIRKAVAALSQFDEQTLRDMGIYSRSQIEQVVRYCRDC